MRLAWGSAKRPDQRIGRCSSNEIHTHKKGPSVSDQMVLHQSCFSLIAGHVFPPNPTQLKWGKELELMKVSHKWLESLTRASVRVVVLLSLSVHLAVNLVCSETAFGVVGPS